MAKVVLDRLEKRWRQGPPAVDGVDLDVANGELVVLVGPSGCGKSTTLRLIAGLESPTGGRVRIGDRDVTDLPPPERDVAMVFQSYALYPHKTVRENLAFPLRMRRTPKAEIERRVGDAAGLLGLGDLLDRRPARLSGGQRQRVALGRALVREPEAFLFDEPLSNLDAKLRVRTRAEIARLHRRLGATMIYVTHDQEEAMTLGDRVAVMDGGRIRQVAPPLEVYREPADAFVAAFIGSPEMNLRPGRVAGDRIEAAGLAFPLPAGAGAAEGEAVRVGVRPGDVRLVPAGEGAGDARVDVIEPLGRDLLVHLLVGTSGGPELRALAPPDADLAEDRTVGVAVAPEALHLFDPETGARRATTSR